LKSDKRSAIATTSYQREAKIQQTDKRSKDHKVPINIAYKPLMVFIWSRNNSIPSGSIKQNAEVHIKIG